MKPVQSLRELARRLNLSPATVSLALRDNAVIAASTRKRVKDAAEHFQFRPDPVMSQIMARPKGRVQTPRSSIGIAYVHHTGDTEDRNKGYWLPQQRSIELAAEQRGFIVEDVNLKNYSKIEALQRQLYQRGFRAIILGAFVNQPALEDFDWSPFVVLAIGRTLINPRFTCLRRDEVAAIRLAWEKVIAAGYKRPGFCLHQHSPITEDDEDRHGAWLHLQIKNPKLAVVPPFLGGFTERASFLQWYGRYKPDVVIGFTGLNLWWLLEAGYSVPGDVAYAQLHLNPEEEEGVAGIVLNDTFEACGRRTIPIIEYLLQTQRFGVTSGVDDIVLVPEWRSGPSLPVCALKL